MPAPKSRVVLLGIVTSHPRSRDEDYPNIKPTIHRVPQPSDSSAPAGEVACVRYVTEFRHRLQEHADLGTPGSRVESLASEKCEADS